MSYTECKTIKAKEDYIRVKLAEDSQWTIRGLVAIWQKQTADEKHVLITKHSNGVGFTGADAEFYSKMAEIVNAGRQLSERQYAAVARGMKKYAGQLRRIADGVI